MFKNLKKNTEVICIDPTWYARGCFYSSGRYIINTVETVGKVQPVDRVSVMCEAGCPHLILYPDFELQFRMALPVRIPTWL